MQIIGGTARGTKLTLLEGKATRPTSQRSREAIFNLLMGGRFAPPLQHAHIIDIFAGTGAIGLEALSRGAAHASFIERDAHACKVLRQNIEKMRMEEITKLYPSVVSSLNHWNHTPADIVFSDAPYAENLTEKALMHMTDIGALKPGALVIAETHKKEHLSLPDNFVLQDRRSYGIAAISLFNWN